MPAVNRTSRQLKKPGVYRGGEARGGAGRKQARRARMYSKIRAGASAEESLAPPQMQQQGRKRKHEEEDEEEEEAAEADPQSEVEEAEAESLAGGDDASSLPSIVPSADGAFSLSLTPFKSSDSSSIASTAPSALSDDRILGAALYEWLLRHQGWECHALWERFQVEWDLITEVERPPGTNRPINLHGYLNFLRSPTNKHATRRDVREVRAALEKERQRELEDNPLNPLAPLQLHALNGPLLHYYLKVKNLMPYESQAQRRKKEAEQRRRRKAEQEPQQQEEQQEEVEEVEEVAQQPKKKQKGADQATAPAAAAGKPGRRVRPSTVGLSQTNSFALLLACD